MSDAYILFPSVHHVLKAEQTVKKHKLQVEMVPVPRALSSDCGIAARTTVGRLPEILRVLAGRAVKPEAVYIEKNKRLVRYEEPAS
ncbi:MAG: DUF3343 domain-containing protein [Planctomycetota bacterium]